MIPIRDEQSKSWLFIAVFTIILFISSVSAEITYRNTGYGLGVPVYGTYIFCNDGRTFSTGYRSGNYWNLDSYLFSVQSANLTVNTLFDSPNMVHVTVHGTAGTESEVYIDASAYGYTHQPSNIGYTGDVSNIYYKMTNTELQLYATHNVDGDLAYEITWTGASDYGGGVTTPVADLPQENVTLIEDPTILDLPDTSKMDVQLLFITIVLGLLVFIALVVAFTNKKG